MEEKGKAEGGNCDIKKPSGWQINVLRSAYNEIQNEEVNVDGKQIH